MKGLDALATEGGGAWTFCGATGGGGGGGGVLASQARVAGGGVQGTDCGRVSSPSRVLERAIVIIPTRSRQPSTQQHV